MREKRERLWRENTNWVQLLNPKLGAWIEIEVQAQQVFAGNTQNFLIPRANASNA